MSRVRRGKVQNIPIGRGRQRQSIVAIESVVLSGDSLPSEVIKRTKSIKPWGRFIKSTGLLERSSSYVRGDRMEGGTGRNGFDWGPGYRPYLKISVLKAKLRINFTRPFPPNLNNKTIRKLTTSLTHWLLTGEKQLL